MAVQLREGLLDLQSEQESGHAELLRAARAGGFVEREPPRMRGEWDCWVPDRSSGRYLHLGRAAYDDIPPDVWGECAKRDPPERGWIGACEGGRLVAFERAAARPGAAAAKGAGAGAGGGRGGALAAAFSRGRRGGYAATDLAAAPGGAAGAWERLGRAEPRMRLGAKIAGMLQAAPRRGKAG